MAASAARGHVERARLADPARRARAALIAGLWDDPSFDAPEAALEDRAEARLLRGDLAEAFALVQEARTTRAIRIRAEALEGLGRFAEADDAVEPAVDTLKANRFTSASPFG